MQDRMNYTEYREMKEKKPSKYRNVKVKEDGYTFDSKKEHEFYLNLRMLKRTKVVNSFKVHPRYLLLEGFEKDGEKFRPVYYEADFEVQYANGMEEIIDTKGVQTEVFRLKRKMFEKRYPEYRLVII